MIRRYAHIVHRRLLARCQGCGERFDGSPVESYGYEWNGWLRSEVGLWHPECKEKQMAFDWDMRSRFDVVGK